MRDWEHSSGCTHSHYPFIARKLSPRCRLGMLFCKPTTQGKERKSPVSFPGFADGGYFYFQQDAWKGWIGHLHNLLLMIQFSGPT